MDISTHKVGELGTPVCHPGRPSPLPLVTWESGGCPQGYVGGRGRGGTGVKAAARGRLTLPPTLGPSLWGW